MLRKTFLALALGAVGMFATGGAQACVWNFGVGTGGALGTTTTPTPDCGSFSTLVLNAFGTGGIQPPTPPQLFRKQAGPSETGIGLTNDPNGDNEINVGNGSIVLNLAGVTGSHGESVDQLWQRPGRRRLGSVRQHRDGRRRRFYFDRERRIRALHQHRRQSVHRRQGDRRQRAARNL